MELKIYWTDFSKKELQKIFDYYKENANLKVAKRLTSLAPNKFGEIF